MSFLSGIFLLALPLAAVPVVLHLYRRRQKTVIPWGAMQFLTAAAHQGRRRERWEELLLMLLRAAAVIALVLALARPQLSGRWLGHSPAREVILVLDDSMSMARDVSGETPHNELVRQLENVLDQMTSRDVVQVIAAVGGPRWLTSEAVPADSITKEQLIAQISALTPTQGTADLFSCLQAAVDVEPASEAQARHVIVLTDGQTYGWKTEALAGWRRLRDAVEVSRVPITLNVIPCGFDDVPVENLAVTKLEASGTQVGLGEQVILRAEVTNTGEAPAAETVLETFANSEQLGQISVPALNAGQSTELKWTWSTATAGVYAMTCRLEAADQVVQDNENAVIVAAVGSIPVLVVESPSGYAQRLPESAFFTTALGYDGDAPQGKWNSVFAPRPVSVDDLGTVSLGEYRAIVLTDVQPLVSDHIERLREFVERGGGLWVALGRQTDREAFNAIWYDEGGGLSPLALDSVVTHTGEDQQEAVVHPPTTDHIATVHLADTNRLDIDAVRIKARHRFEPPSRGQELSVLLETGDGEPLVVENYIGRGRVIIQALPLDISWSNLPLTKSYVVMVQDWLEYLTQPAATQFNLAPGGRIELTRPASSAIQSVSINLPDATRKSLTPRDGGDVVVYRYSQTQIPGRYDVEFDGSDETHTVPFRVARDARESELVRLEEEQEVALSEAAGLRFSKDAVGIVPPITGGRGQQPIWNTLLVALLALLAGELLLATRAARRRSPGTALPPELAAGPVSLSAAEAEKRSSPA